MALTDLTRISTSGIATGTSLSGAILHGDAHFRGTQVGVTSALFDSSENELNLKDNVKLTFGSSSGADAEIFHDASAGINDLKIIDKVGHLKLETSSNKDVIIKTGSTQKINLKAVATEGVELNFDGTKRFETTNHGAFVTGILTATSFSGGISGDTIGNVYAASGISTFYDLRVSNNLTVEGTTTTLDTNLIGVDRVEVGANSNSIVGVAITQSGTADIVNLFDGATKVVTVDDTGKVGIGSAAPAALLNLMSSNPIIRLTDSDNSGYSAIGGESGFLYFYTHTSTRDFIFRGSEEVARITGDGMLGIGTHTPGQALHLIDNKKIALGQGQDLKLFHDGNHSMIENDTGILRIVGKTGQKIDFCDDSYTTFYARFNSGSQVNLFYNNSPKFATQDYGASISGNIRLTTGGDGYTFITDTDTGMHNPSDGNLHFKVNGVDRFSMNTSGISTFHNQKIHIEGAGSGNTPLTINTDVASNNSVNPLIEAYADNASYKAQIGLVRDGSSGALGWAFFNSNAGSTEEALRINSYGQVGINTSVGGQLAIAMDSSNTNPLATGFIALSLKNTNTTDNTSVCMDFNNSVGGIVGRIGAQFVDTSDKNTDLYFATRSNGGALAERLRIKADGQIYVGADDTDFSDVGTFFNLKNDTYGGRIGFSNNTATAGVALMEQFAYWGTNKIAGFIAQAGTDTSNKDDGELVFYTRYSGASVAEALRIKDDGEIRIRGVKSGNAVPNVVLTFDILNSNGDTKKAEIKATKTADISSELIFSTTVSHSFDERMRIDEKGRLLVGLADDPAESSIVAEGNSNSGTSYAVLDLRRGAAASASGNVCGYIRFSDTNIDATSRNYAWIAGMADGASSSGSDNPGRLVFATCPDGSTALAQRLIIDNQGNVKTGTVASALNFTDSNSGNTKSIEIGATSGGDALLVTHSSGYGVGYFGYEAGGDRLVIACDGGGGNNKIDFITSAGTSTGGGTDNLSGKVPRMRIASDGKVGINNSDPQTILNVKGTISTGRNVAREVGTATASTNFNSARSGANVISGQKNYEAGGGDWLTPGHSRDNAYVTIDLGANYNICRAVIYNQNEYVNSRRECKGFTLEASTDNSNWTTIINDELGRSNGHEPNPGWSFRIPSVFNDDSEYHTARYWKFTMLTFHGSDPYGGINEIELYEHSDSVIDEVTSASVVAGDVYAETAAFKRITHDGGQKINMGNDGANGVDAGMSLGLDGSNSFFALGQVGESGFPMIYKTYRINSPGNNLSATHVLMEADSNTNAIVMNGILTIFPGRAGYNQQRGFIQYGINYSAYSGSLYGDHYELHRHGVTGYSNLAIVKSGLKVQLEVTSNTAAVGRIHMIWQGQLYNHRHNY